MSKLHIIYIPGLGDRNISRQFKIISHWRMWNVMPEVYQMCWDDDKPWEVKFKNLLKRIDELSAQGKKLGLVGASAGASAVINAFAARKDKIVGVVCIAGKINNPEAIGPRYREHNPSFVTSAYKVPDSLKSLNKNDRSRILSRYGLYDPIVRKADSHLSGANNHSSPTLGHVFTIAFQIIIGAPSFLKFLKKLAQE